MLIKYTGKYVNIYFIMKITFSAKKKKKKKMCIDSGNGIFFPLSVFSLGSLHAWRFVAALQTDVSHAAKRKREGGVV